jgi:photosynthetic reaction center cytochrome c subunit
MNIGHSWRNGALLAGAFAICILGLLWKPQGLIARTSPPQEPAAKKVTAGDAYMNVQVLKDIPSDQLLPSMRYITVALGVSCDYCHEAKDFDSDDKPEKVTARKMMAMMLAINKDNFNGRREVTCYTCHHGASKAVNTPVAMAVAAAAIGSGGAMPPSNGGPAGSPAAVPSTGNAAGSTAAIPTVDDILAKYTEALGGSAAVEKITTLSEKGTAETPAHGRPAAAEVFRKAPNKAMAVLHAPPGDIADGFNGTTGWHQRPGHGAEDLEGDELVRTKQWAAFIPGLDLKQDFARAQVAGVDKIGDRDAYRVIAFRAGGGQVRFYFDKESGLLIRVSERIESFLGALPQETNYSDYRDVNGVKMPFNVIVAHGDTPTIYKWERIEANVPIDDARFEKPAEKAAQ